MGRPSGQSVVVVGIEGCRERTGPAAPQADSDRTNSAASMEAPVLTSSSRVPFTTPSAQVLSLDQLISKHPQDRAFEEATSRFDKLSHPWPEDHQFWTLNFLLELPDLSHQFRTWLEQVPRWSHEPVQHVHIYVDGSSYNLNRQEPVQALAAWAFIVVLSCLEQNNDFSYRFYCASSQELVSSSNANLRPGFDMFSHLEVGELLADALSAEAVGMIWVLAWVAQMPFSCPTTIHFDNCTIGPFAAGNQQWNASWEYHKLKNNLSSLRHFLSERTIDLRFDHVKAHVGFPWSEAVDAFAKATAKRVLNGICFVKDVAHALRHPASSFAWLGSQNQVSAPALVHLRTTFQSEGPGGQNIPTDTTWWHDATTKQTESVKVQIGFATANVLNLSGGTTQAQSEGLPQLGRISTLQAQFSQTSCSIIGLQECRTRDALARHSQSHLVYQSGSDSFGTKGCELWLDRLKPYAVAGKRQYLFDPSHVQVTSYDARHILVLINAPHLRLRILTLHAPHQTATDVHLDSWWAFIQQQVSRTSSDAPLVVLADTNSRLGSIVSEAVGSHQAEEESSTGHSLHSFLLDNALWSPSTFSHCHTGDATTWISPCGKPCRLDFVFLPDAWKNFDVHSYVQHDIDLALLRHDHFVVAADVQMHATRSPRKVAHACRLDTRKCQDPQAREGFLQYLQNPPQIPWHVGVGHHAEVLTKWLQAGAMQHFKKDKALPRQRYMSPRTWDIVQLRQQLNLMFRQANNHQKDLQKRMFLHRWVAAYKNRTTSAMTGSTLKTLPVLQQCSRLLRLQSLWTLWYRRKMHPIARFCSRQDRIEVIQQVTDEFHVAAHSRDSSQLYRALKPLLGQTHRKHTQAFKPVPAVTLEDGQLAPSFAEAGERWRTHFAKPEQGMATTVCELQQILVNSHQAGLVSALPLDLQAIPTRQEIAEYIMKTRKHKSPGPDGLPGDIYQLSPSSFSKILWPLLAKVSIRCEEPLRWKGGEVCSLPKSAMAGHAVDKYRSILLADFLSKVSHGVLRKKLLPPFEAFRQPMQAGRVPLLGTDMLNLFVQSHAQHTRFCGLSSAALYVDIRHAFYSVCRPLVVNGPIHESHLAAFFAEKQWSSDMFQDFLAQIHADLALAQAKVTPHLAAQVQSMLTATWFQMRGMPETLTHTQAGTRPGDPVADLLFAYLMTRFLNQLDSEFAAHGLQSSFPLTWIPPGVLGPDEQSHAVVSTAAWVDDLVILLQASTPATLIAKARCAMQLVFDTAVTFGLDLNLAKDKTSLLLAPRGPGARQMWSSILAEDPCHPKLEFECQSLSQPADIAIVPDYIYLGSLHDHTGHPAVDVKCKFLSIQAIRKVLKKGVFKSPLLPLRTKCQLFQSLVMSRMTFSIGAWQKMHMHTARSWQTQLVNLYSQIHDGVHRGPHMHNLDIVAGSYQPHPMMVLAQARLQLYDRLMQTEMVPLFALLQSQCPQDGWLSMICQDIQHLAQYVAHDELETLAADKNHAQLAQLSFRQPKLLAKFANRGKQRYQQYLAVWRVFRQFQARFDQEAMRYEVTWTHPTDNQPRPGTFVCETCQKTFADHHALCTHVYKCHQVLNTAHRYAISHRCRACLKQYHSRNELIHHLKYFRTGCLIKLILTVPPLSDEELDGVLEEMRQIKNAQKRHQRQKAHRVPLQQCSGPLRPWPWAQAQAFARQDTRTSSLPQPAVVERWTDDVLESLDACSVAATYQLLIQQPYHGSLAQHLCVSLSALHLHLPGTPSSYHAEKHLVLQEAICLWQDSFQVPKFRLNTHVDFATAITSLHLVRMPSEHQSHDVSVVSRRTQLQDNLWQELSVPHQVFHELERLHNRSYSWPAPQAPRLTRTPVYIYLYSGRRRHGDFQSQVEHFLTRFSSKGQVLLLDLAISERHDATQPTLINTLLQWFHSGCVAGFLAAPPCETWSEVRHLEVDALHAPRPLRSARYPFGVPQLQKGELEQLLISTQLLFTALLLFLVASLTSTPAILEHPREPRGQDRASIWRLPWMRALRESGLVQLHVIRQAEFGAKSSKPTHLAVCHAPDFWETMGQHRIHVDWSNLDVLHGKHADGSWRTSAAKEYPELLNRALAHTLVQASQGRASRDLEHDVDIPSFIEEFTFLYAADVSLENQHMQPDYAKHLYKHLDQLD